ncbi:unnamed protein product, partial [Coregonus sp. 'balchen']
WCACFQWCANLEHTLTWLPGPGTPANTHFTVQSLSQWVTSTKETVIGYPEYCVTVTPATSFRPHSVPSEPHCAFTSPPATSTDDPQHDPFNLLSGLPLGSPRLGLDPHYIQSVTPRPDTREEICPRPDQTLRRRSVPGPDHTPGRRSVPGPDHTPGRRSVPDQTIHQGGDLSQTRHQGGDLPYTEEEICPRPDHTLRRRSVPDQTIHQGGDLSQTKPYTREEICPRPDHTLRRRSVPDQTIHQGDLWRNKMKAMD